MSVPSLQADRSIRARVLGSADIRIGDRLLVPGSWPRRQARTIFLMLLATPGHRISRDWLLDTNWPEQDPSTQLNALYKAIHALRRTLEPGLANGKDSAFIDVSNEHIALRPHAGFHLDVDLFESFLRSAERLGDPRDRLRAALDLYRGPLLGDEPFSDWPVERREALEAIRLHATLRLARLDREHDQPNASLGYLESLLIDQPACEAAHQAIIAAHLQTGRDTLALQQVERCRTALDGQLDQPLSAETEALADLARHNQSNERTSRSAVEVLRRERLPGVPNPTIGRRREIDAITALFADPNGPRLVTIVGIGGVGKTRLAIEAARHAAVHAPDGSVFVDFSAIRDPHLFHAALAGALGIRPGDSRSMSEQIHTALKRRPRQLLVFDNLEHLPGVDTRVADLLAAHPHLKILATSREALRIRPEWRFRLEPFEAPGPESGANAQQLRRNDAVALFLQCARAWNDGCVAPAFDLNEIAALVRALDGLPLAIELAAARSDTFSPQTMLSQISNRFALLREGPGDLPERQQTLEASIAWSYHLLVPEEQELFRNLSVFTGGVEIDTLQALFGEQAIARTNLLAERSLVCWVHIDGGRRLTMLESLRAFAGLRLAESGELDPMRAAHAVHFADLVARADEDPIERAVIEIDWMQRLSRDHDNLHLALSNSLETGDAETALKLTNGLGYYWMTRLAPSDARIWTERALALGTNVTTDDAGWTAIWGAEQSSLLGDWAAVDRFVERARSIWRPRSFTSGLAWADGAMANGLARRDRHEEAIAIHRTNTEVFERIRDYEGIVTSLAGTAWSLERIGRFDEAVAILTQAIAAACASEHRILESFLRARLVTLLVDLDRVEEADRRARSSERLARLIGDLPSLPCLLTAQAWGCCHRADAAGALEMSRRSLAAFDDLTDQRTRWWGLLTCLAIELPIGAIESALGLGIELIEELRTTTERLAVTWSYPILGRLLVAIDEPDLARAAAGELADPSSDRPAPPAVLRHRCEVARAAAAHSAASPLLPDDAPADDPRLLLDLFDDAFHSALRR